MLIDYLRQLVDLWPVFVTLAGVAALRPALVNILKFAGVVHDGQAKTYGFFFDLVFFGVFAANSIFGLGLDVGGLDAVILNIAQVLTAVVALLGQLGVGNLSYTKLVANLAPTSVLGYSFSRQAPEEPHI